MKKITFKVTTPKKGSIIDLIKEVNKISCRILLDIENGFVTVENVGDAMIDTVIELIDNYYTLLGVDIDNSVESDVDTSTIVTDKPEVTRNDVATKTGTLEPQSEDDLIIEKIEFENEYVEQLVNKFLRTAYWAMFKMNIPEREIGDFIWTSINEISMRYNKKESIAFSIGDVVDCNYGIHLAGEINGGHVSAIVCNISDTGMAYVVPITKNQENLTSHSYLTFTVPNDIIYDTRDYTGGTVLLDKGKYVRPERFHEVIGKTTPEFLAEVLNQLAITFDFINANTKDVEIPADTDVPSGEKATDETTEVVPVEDSKTVETNAETKSTYKKVGDVETALMETVGFAFDKLDSSKPVNDQIDSFLSDIGMTTNERMITQSFVIACDIKKITYENVILELHNKYPKVNEDIIKVTLKENFKKWLENYPELAKKCPKLSLMSVLKVFAKRFA